MPWIVPYFLFIAGFVVDTDLLIQAVLSVDPLLNQDRLKRREAKYHTSGKEAVYNGDSDLH